MRPSLVLDFAGGHVDRRIASAVRDSRAWRHDARGLLVPSPINTPRLDHDPATGKALGLRVEAARTNLQPYSQDATQWTPNNVTVTANAGTGGDGKATAGLITEDATTAIHAVTLPAAALTATGPHTLSVEVEPAGRGVFALRMGGGVFGGSENRVEFDVATGQAAVETGAPDDYGIIALGGGRYRIWMSVETTSTGNTSGVLYLKEMFGGPREYAGDGASGALVWGAQYEDGAYPGTHVPTASSAVTRAADTVTMALGAWFNGAQGTVLVRARTAAGGGTSQYVAHIDDGSTSNRYAMYRNSGGNVQIIPYSAGNVSQGTLSLGSVPDDAEISLAFAWASDDCAACLNGGEVVAGGSVTLPAGLTTLRLGRFFGGGYEWGGTIARVAFWPRRLSDDVLPTLTI